LSTRVTETVIIFRERERLINCVGSSPWRDLEGSNPNTAAATSVRLPPLNMGWEVRSKFKMTPSGAIRIELMKTGVKWRVDEWWGG
jgi:hypothetical protein